MSSLPSAEFAECRVGRVPSGKFVECRACRVCLVFQSYNVPGYSTLIAFSGTQLASPGAPVVINHTTGQWVLSGRSNWPSNAEIYSVQMLGCGNPIMIEIW